MTGDMVDSKNTNSDVSAGTLDDEKVLRRAIARLRAGIMAVTFGMTAGFGLFVATLWLVIRGGQSVGFHLVLLEHYFPGYSVTWWGAFVGGTYAAVVGAVVGASIAWIYNRIAFSRNGI